jgi:hypothetical protein
MKNSCLTELSQNKVNTKKMCFEHFLLKQCVLPGPIPGIRCGVPPPLENGFYSAEDFYAGSTVTYQCNSGYYLLGDSRMFCTDNGSWNGISPSCLGEINVGSCSVGLF